MNLSFVLIMTCFCALFMAACAGSKTVYRQNELDMLTIKREFIDKKRSVQLRFFVQKDLMYEETGLITSSPKENYIVFQYYDYNQRNFIDVELPLKNISEISYKKGAFEFDRTTRIAAAISMVVAVFILYGMSTAP